MGRALAQQKEVADHLQAEFANVQKVVARLAEATPRTLALNH